MKCSTAGRYPPLATTESTNFEDWLLCVLGLSGSRMLGDNLSRAMEVAGGSMKHAAECVTPSPASRFRHMLRSPWASQLEPNRQSEPRTVGDCLTRLFVQDNHGRGVDSSAILATHPPWQLIARLNKFEEECTVGVSATAHTVGVRAINEQRLVVVAAQQVAEALWLQKRPQFEQLDLRDKRSALARRGLTAPLLWQEDAEAVRELLMAERGKIGKNWQGGSFEREFSLCEH